MIKILLIDHSLGHPTGIRQLLAKRTSNLEVDCVSSYREILQGFRNKTYDVCVIDSLMDNGLKLFAQARSFSFAAPVVLVISDSARAAVQALRNGAADCLVRDELSVAQIERSVCYVVEQARNLSMRCKRERRHLALLENAREIVFSYEIDGRFTSINRSGERVIGYSEAEILAMNIAEVVVPSDRGLIERMTRQTIDARTPLTERIHLVTRDEQSLAVEINTYPIQQEGQAIEIQVVARPERVAHPTNRSLEERVHRVREEFSIHSIPDRAGTISPPFGL